MNARFPLFAVALLLAGTAVAQDVKVEKYRLKNGLTVILHEDHSVPIVTINTWFRVGSKDEPPRRSGFAHLFEHLMFMGTKRVPQGQFDEWMEAAGGSNNASTSSDRTNYFSSGPSNLLPTLLWLDADRLAALGANIDQKKLDLQRDVVKNERRQNVEEQPMGEAWESIDGLMFPPEHPYHTGVIGSHEDLSAATVKDVQDFFAAFYTPNNASLVVAGDFRSAEVKPLIERYYGGIPRANDPARKPAPPARLDGVVRRTMVDRVEHPTTLMVWHSPAAHQPGDTEMDLASSILGQGENSRLYAELVTKRKLATEVGAFQNSQLLGSLFYVTATAAEGVELDDLERAIDEVLATFRKSGPTADELRRQAAQTEMRTLSGLQSIGRKADQLNEYEFYFGEPNSFKRVLDRVRSATPAQTRQAADKVLDPGRRLILRVVPSVASSADEALDEKPAIGDPGGFVPQLPTEVALSNGMKALVWHRPELPLVAMTVRFGRGADTDEAGKLGQASMAGDLVAAGGAKLDAAGFQSALDRLGASLGVGVGHEDAQVSLQSTAPNFGKALDLAAEAVRRPRFDPGDFERIQRIGVAARQQSLNEPGSVASLVSMRAFFGPGNPAGRPVEGTVATLKGLRLEDVREAHARVFRPDQATVFLAGSLTADEARAHLERAFGGWKPEGPAVAAPVYPNPAREGMKVLIVDRPGAGQTAIRFVMPAPSYSDPARPALESLSTLLGGMFTSRLNLNLREDKGYTYGAGTRAAFGPSFSYWLAVADVKADVTGASLREFLAEFRRLRSGDVTPEEAAKAASTRRTGVIEGLSTLNQLIGTAVRLSQNGVPFGGLAEELRSIGALTAADLNAAAQASLAYEQGVLVLVGDRAAILPQLEGLGLPAPEIVVPE